MYGRVASQLAYWGMRPNQNEKGFFGDFIRTLTGRLVGKSSLVGKLRLIERLIRRSQGRLPRRLRLIGNLRERWITRWIGRL